MFLSIRLDSAPVRLGLACSHLVVLTLICAPTTVAAQDAYELIPPSATAWNIGLRVVAASRADEVDGLPVRFREQDQTEWRVGLSLTPVSERPGQTLFAASLLQLRPATAYEIVITTPAEELAAIVTTRAEPTEHVGRPVHVTPATFADALASAEPGDRLVLARGKYVGPFVVSRGGTEDEPVTIVASDGAETVLTNPPGELGAVIRGAAGAHFVHLRDLVVEGSAPAHAIRGGGSRGWVVSGCLIYGSIRAGRRDWWIEDNFLVGRYADWNTRRESVPGGTGIDVEGTGHVVAHNQVGYFYDGINTADPFTRNLDWPFEPSGLQRGTDIVGNLVYAAHDDGIQVDHIGINHRVHGNRVFWAFAGISLQSLTPGPVFATRNVITDVGWEAWKLMSGSTGIRLFHNTSVSAFGAYSQTADISNLIALNNVFVGTRGATIGPRTGGSQWDHNGYGLGAAGQFGWRTGALSDPVRFDGLPEFAAASLQETNGVVIDLAVDLTGPLISEAGAPIPVSALHPSEASSLRGAARNVPMVAGVNLTVGALDGSSIPRYGPRRLVPGAAARGLYLDRDTLVLTLDPIGYSPLTMKEQIVRFIDVYNVSLPLMTGLAFALGLLIGVLAATWWARRRSAGARR